MQISNISLYNNGVIVVYIYILVILLTDKAMGYTYSIMCVVKCVVDAMAMILSISIVG